MRKVDALLADYAAYHQTRGNVVCHFLGIPLIVLGGFILLESVHLFAAGSLMVTAAWLLVALSTVYYLTLDLRLGFGMLIVSVALLLLARIAGDLRYGIAAFAIGWIFQAIGHIAYEKKSPAFLRNMVHLLVGPVFLLNEALHIRPVNLQTPA